MDIRKKYLILDEESNAIDYLSKSVEFLEKIEASRTYLKWFIIAFHGAVYSLILLNLYKINSQQIFKDNKTNLHPLDRELKSFKSVYELLKDRESMRDNPYKPERNQDVCIVELNDKLRNKMVHFPPTLWAAEPWYFAEACYPLLDVLRFCIKDFQFGQVKKEKLLQDIEKIEKVLDEHID